MTAKPSVGSARRFALTDLGNAERLVAMHGRDMHWITAWKSWLVWDGRRWKRDDSCEVERRAKSAVRSMWTDVRDLDGDEKAYRDELKKHAHQSEAIHKLKAMLEGAKAEPGTAVPYSDFDAKPMLFNVTNGTLDLERQELRAHQRGDLLTKAAAVAYDPSAECPRWVTFLDQIFGDDQELIAYLQRAIGYSMTGDTREQCLHLLHGSGSNGKSTFLEVLADVFGEYGVQADFATFLDKHGDGPRNDVARLAGARMVRSSEVGEGKRLNEALVKALTGTDTVAARFLYSEAFEFRPTFKLWLAANHKPVIRGTDFAIWRRVRLVPFLVTIQDKDKDAMLPTTLKQELPGILNWCLTGLASWFEIGLRPPDVVTASTDQYRTESDVIGAFIEESCRLDADARAGATELYGAYKRWSEAAGEHVLSQTAFGRRLEERGHVSVKSSGVKFRQGLRLVVTNPNGQEQKPWFK